MRINASDGTQSVRRALQLLRLLALHEPDGLSLKEITLKSGLERSTAHRLVSALVEEQFIYRNTETKRLQIGIDAMQIGASALGNASITEQLKPLVMKLVRLVEDTVFLVVQQGDQALCLMHEHGNFPARIFTITVGEKRLLGIGAGGLALLSTYSDDAIERIYLRHETQYASLGFSLAQLMRRVEETRHVGYSQIVGAITPGISGVGHAFYLSRITQVAISFGAIESRMGLERRQQLGELLKVECAGMFD